MRSHIEKRSNDKRSGRGRQREALQEKSREATRVVKGSSLVLAPPLTLTNIEAIGVIPSSSPLISGVGMCKQNSAYSSSKMPRYLQDDVQVTQYTAVGRSIRAIFCVILLLFLIISPSHTATATGSVRMMKLLIDRGADIAAAAAHDIRRTAVHVATFHGRVKALGFYSAGEPTLTLPTPTAAPLLFLASASSAPPEKRLAISRILLDGGADAAYASSSPNGLGGTALLLSTARKDLGMIDLLVTRAPAALDMCYMIDPLMQAARLGLESAVIRLLKAGARYKPGSWSGRELVPFDAALSQGGEGWAKCPLEAAIGGGHTPALCASCSLKVSRCWEPRRLFLPLYASPWTKGTRTSCGCCSTCKEKTRESTGQSAASRAHPLSPLPPATAPSPLSTCS